LSLPGPKSPGAFWFDDGRARVERHFSIDVQRRSTMRMMGWQLFLVLGVLSSRTLSFQPPIASRAHGATRLYLAETNAGPPTPVLNGKRVLPFKVMSAGLKGQKAVAAVYAVMNDDFKKAADSEGWQSVVYVGVSQDLQSTLQRHAETHGASKVAHIRALTFSFPQPNAMQAVAQQWRELGNEAGANLQNWQADAIDYLYDDDDDDDDDDDEDDWDVTGQGMATTVVSDSTTVISPFESTQEEPQVLSTPSTTTALAFTSENVDKVLDEVRPYLISDGGNVAVVKVDEENKNVYLKLEGACGSCASSTITMSMGIERVLKENFADLNQVLQVEDIDPNKPTELTYQVVQDEVNRLMPAVLAMGGACEIVSVDAALGSVELKFRGANRVQQGLELALRDVQFVNHVKFVMGND
jgi:Fe-S cluster biogenesis protein NfuA